MAEVDAFLTAAAGALAALPPERMAGSSLGGFLDLVPGDERARAVVRARLEGTCAADLSTVSLRGFTGRHLFAAEPAIYARLAAGNQGLATAMAAEFGDVRLGATVERVIRSGDGVTVAYHTEAGPGVARTAAAVVAVPAPLVGSIAFEPALPDELERALAELPMGVAAKLALPLDQPVALRSIQGAELPFWCWVARGVDGEPRPVLTSFAGGPLARGSYSSWDERSLDRDELFARRVDRIAFAGEHTAGADHHGTMEGALRSGERAAAQLLGILV